VKDPRIGRQVRSLGDLICLSREGKSVTPSMQWKLGEGWKSSTPKPTPAAFVVNRIGTDIHRLLRDGLFVYKPIPRQRGIRKGFRRTEVKP